jgi:hypothetical protein
LVLTGLWVGNILGFTGKFLLGFPSANEPARLPEEHKPLVLTDEMQEEWERLVLKKTAKQMNWIQDAGGEGEAC